MNYCNKYLLMLIWFSIINVIGIFLFTKGFLLKRSVVDLSSNCKVNFSSNVNDHEHDGTNNIHGHLDNDDKPGCWMHLRFKKTVMIVIDALRFDFVKYNYGQAVDLPYQNKMKTINHLLHKKPLNSRLYQFIADPPTTTLQRLKGLTTGSLPTFVDAGANFASSEITEDNIIDQLTAHDKKIVFMGDDTWDSLFPRRFHRSYFFPSFDVKDLHTVDDGVTANLIPEIKKKDWDVIIAHYLGVDHCGHRYGPNHPAMEDKLNQMDKIIR